MQLSTITGTALIALYTVLLGLLITGTTFSPSTVGILLVICLANTYQTTRLAALPHQTQQG